MYPRFLKKILTAVVIDVLVLIGVLILTPSVFADSGTGLPPPALITPATQSATYVGTYTEWNITLSDAVESVYVHPYWTVIGGSLPEGMTLQQSAFSSRTAKIVGTPIFYGAYPIELMVDTGRSFEDNPKKAYTLTVRPMEILPTGLPDGRVQSAYSQALTATGGTAPYRWDISGRLPTGLNLSASGVISGTPLVAETTTCTVSVSDSAGHVTSRSFTISAAPMNELSISTVSIPNGTVGTAYTTNIVGFGGSGAQTFSLSGGTIPPGLAFASNGVLSGIPTLTGSYSLTVKLTDAVGGQVTRVFSAAIAPAPASSPSGPNISTTSLPNGTVAVWYGYNLGVTGGTTPYQWIRSSGALPPGLTLDPVGSLYGSPTTAGVYPFDLQVRDALGAVGTKSYIVTIAAVTPPSTTWPLPGTGTVGTPSAGTAERLSNLMTRGIAVHDLIKLPDDGNRFTQEDTAVYYVGADGRRHAFPNSKVYFTWYAGFDGVRTIAAGAMASIPLGANATYHPGTRMVKFTTDPKVYAVSSDRKLCWVATEEAARSQYGVTWNQKIDDIADTFYTDYQFGADIRAVDDFNPAMMRDSVNFVSDTLTL